jgi:hypothetical protein
MGDDEYIIMQPKSSKPVEVHPKGTAARITDLEQQLAEAKDEARSCREANDARFAYMQAAALCRDHVAEFTGNGCLVCQRDAALARLREVLGTLPCPTGAELLARFSESTTLERFAYMQAWDDYAAAIRAMEGE